MKNNYKLLIINNKKQNVILFDVRKNSVLKNIDL